MEPGVFVIIIPQISVPAETFACCLFLQMIGASDITCTVSAYLKISSIWWKIHLSHLSILNDTLSIFESFPHD